LDGRLTPIAPPSQSRDIGKVRYFHLDIRRAVMSLEESDALHREANQSATSRPLSEHSQTHQTSS